MGLRVKVRNPKTYNASTAPDKIEVRNMRSKRDLKERLIDKLSILLITSGSYYVIPRDVNRALGLGFLLWSLPNSTLIYWAHFPLSFRLLAPASFPFPQSPLSKSFVPFLFLFFRQWMANYNAILLLRSKCPFLFYALKRQQRGQNYPTYKNREEYISIYFSVLQNSAWTAGTILNSAYIVAEGNTQVAAKWFFQQINR